MQSERYRVAQWGTGVVGMCALRAIIAHPDYDLVGVKVYSDAKVGRDAGDISGVGATGVIATTDIEDIIAAKPDCVLYMPDHAEIDVLCRLLEVGINIATPRMEFNFRDRIEPEMRGKLEAACLRGQASLYASGSTPGWFTEIMPLALSALERRLDCMTITDFADLSSRDSPEMLFKVLPFGAELASLDQNASVGPAKSSLSTLAFTAAAMGLPIEEFVTGCDFALTRTRTEIAAGTVEPGTIGAIRMNMAGLHNGKPVIRRCSTYYVTRDVEPAWDLRETGVHFRVEGDVPLDVMITIPASAAEYPDIEPAMTANPIVNAVPFVCKAAPGILHTDELPPIIARLGS